ncbi:hypothetical protein B0H14DRAFT_2607493 [Mycena olivaceomarginata]|nr:hypothetical protein B0H14DRAFT_2607493 [Mycena olivaceomarginata]
MPPVRRTTGRATRRRRRPNYRDRSSVRSPPVLITDGIHAELAIKQELYVDDDGRAVAPGSAAQGWRVGLNTAKDTRRCKTLEGDAGFLKLTHDIADLNFTDNAAANAGGSSGKRSVLSLVGNKMKTYTRGVAFAALRVSGSQFYAVNPDCLGRKSRAPHSRSPPSSLAANQESFFWVLNVELPDSAIVSAF